MLERHLQRFHPLAASLVATTLASILGTILGTMLGAPSPALAQPSGAPTADSSAAPPAPIAAALERAQDGDMAGAASLLEPLVDGAAGGDARLEAAARELLGAVYLQLGRPAAAATALAPLVASPEASAVVLFNAARAALASGDAETAERFLERSVAKDPHTVAAVTLARHRATQGRHEDVVDLLDPLEIGGADPAMATAIARMLATALVALDRAAEAVPVLERWTELAPEDREAWRLLGDANIELERYEAAHAAMAEAQRIEEEAIAAEVEAARGGREELGVEEALQRVVSAYEAGRYEEALGGLAAAIRAEPNDPRPYALEIRLLVQLGRAAEAAPKADAMVRILPEQAESLFLRGLVGQALGDVAAATADFERALELDPGHAAARERLETLREPPR